MYRLTPFTCTFKLLFHCSDAPVARVLITDLFPSYLDLIEGLLANSMGGQPIACKPTEFAIVVPPSGQECAAFLQPYIDSGFGYSQVQPNGDCGYCNVCLIARFGRFVIRSCGRR